MASFHRWGSTASWLQSHYDEAVYLLSTVSLTASDFLDRSLIVSVRNRTTGDKFETLELVRCYTFSIIMLSTLQSDYTLVLQHKARAESNSHLCLIFFLWTLIEILMQFSD